MDWSNASSELIREVVDRGETYLQAQLTVATSADQRAAAMAGMFSASAAAIAAGLVAAVTANAAQAVEGLEPVLAGGIVSGLLFLTGAILCTLAIMPTGFYFPGTQPEKWEIDLAGDKKVDAALAELGENYQIKIDDNRNTINRNARKFRWGSTAGIAAPVVGLIVWAVTSFYPQMFGTTP